MPYKVQFVGLVCFYHGEDMRWALLPDGRNPGGDIEPHQPSILIASDAIEESHGWGDGVPDANGKITPPPCTLMLEGANTPGPLDSAQQDARLPHLREIDASFEIDLEQAEAVLRMPIRQGTLTASIVPGGSALISELVVPHDGPITITATPADGSPSRTLRLKPGTEILIGNMAEGGIYSQVQPGHHFRHFQIYEKLSSVRPVTLPEPEPEIANVASLSQSQHWYFMRRGPINLSVSCSNSQWP